MARALRGLGHTVECTGPIWHGWQLPKTDEDMARIDGVVATIVAARADVVVAMRPAALHPKHLKFLRRRGIRTVAWFADDPVFFRKQSTRVAALYDLTLHTAMDPVLELYERELGVRGIGMPFWADQVDFPRCYSPSRCDVDVVFIGNLHTSVKRWRYEWIRSLPVTSAIYGKVKEDPAGLVAGFIDEPTALARAAARGRFGLNISQRFADYSGSIFDFPGLADLGEFPLPSRVVELASVGVPVLALVGTDRAADDMAALFPPALVVRDQAGVADAVAAQGERSLSKLSDSTHAWYATHYSADARAAFLHAVLRRPRHFMRMDARRRALVFLEHPTPHQAQVARMRRLMPVADAVWRVRMSVSRLLTALWWPARRILSGARRRVRVRFGSG